jgi:hypothetical protein
MFYYVLLQDAVCHLQTQTHASPTMHRKWKLSSWLYKLYKVASRLQTTCQMTGTLNSQLHPPAMQLLPAPAGCCRALLPGHPNLQQHAAPQKDPQDVFYTVATWHTHM